MPWNLRFSEAASKRARLLLLYGWTGAFLADCRHMSVLGDEGVSRKGLADFDDSVRLDVLRTAPTPRDALMGSNPLGLLLLTLQIRLFTLKEGCVGIREEHVHFVAKRRILLLIQREVAL